MGALGRGLVRGRLDGFESQRSSQVTIKPRFALKKLAVCVLALAAHLCLTPARAHRTRVFATHAPGPATCSWCNHGLCCFGDRAAPRDRIGRGKRIYMVRMQDTAHVKLSRQGDKEVSWWWLRTRPRRGDDHRRHQCTSSLTVGAPPQIVKRSAEARTLNRSVRLEKVRSKHVQEMK